MKLTPRPDGRTMVVAVLDLATCIDRLKNFISVDPGISLLGILNKSQTGKDVKVYSYF